MNAGRALSRLAALTLVVAFAAPAYYHFVRFENGTRQVERFDLDALVDSRVLFYASTDQQPRLQVNDSVPAVLSQIRQALSVWDNVPGSALGVGFGGVIEGELPGQTPAGQIVFAELPPGVLGMGGPVTRGRAADGSPVIIRSQVLLSTDLVNNARSRTSFSELFFSTLVHEIGHALGLQHTLASSAMSTDVTRATTRARPLAADDVAGLAALYPTESFPETAAITGRVVFTDGRPVSLASVAAVHPDGQTVTALSDPNGAYRIEGLRPAEYLIYVQPLPPSSQEGLGPANIVLPTGLRDSPHEFFRSTFFGAVSNPRDADRIRVAAGQTLGPVSFAVEPAAQPPVRSVTTYAFPGNNAPGVHPAFLDLTESPDFALAIGPGLDASVQVETFDPELSLLPARPYEFDARFLRLDFNAAPFARLGPADLLFRSPDNFYVLPSAVRLTSSPAPLLYWLTPDFASDDPAAWRLRGDGLDPGSSVYFDGEPARILDFTPDGREFSVLPPPAAPGHAAVVTVYNPDGQSSAFTLPDGNVIFEYPDRPDARISVSPQQVPQGRDVVVDVEVANMPLEPGRVELGVGTSDVVVRRVQVLSPTRLRAVVYASPEAEPGAYDLTLVNGLHLVRQEDAFRVAGPALILDNQPALRFRSLVNAATGQTAVAPGSLATLFGERLASAAARAPDAGVRVTFDGVPALVTGVTSSQIDLVVPEDIDPGLVEIRVFNGDQESEPMLAEISRSAPGMFGVFRSDGVRADATTPVQAGRSLTILATGLGPGSPFVQVDVGGLRFFPDSTAPGAEPGLSQIRITVPAGLFGTGETASISLLVNGRRSNRLPLVFAADAAAGAVQ